MEFDPTRIRPAPDATVIRDAGQAIPQRIGQVELGAQLGAGGMAGVFLGLDHGFTPPRQVAVKLMDPALGGDDEFRQRFEREASLVGNFRHDSVVHVYASGQTAEGMKYIVMEYLAGGTLTERLQAGPLAPDEALGIAATMADALAYSHARGVVHRDFKPGNILFTAEGKPVLSDFGVAKVLTAKEAGLTRYAVSVGAPSYMAPEQDRGEEVTDRADIYALGITVVELLTGLRFPARLRIMQGDASVAQMRDVLPPDLPPGVATLVCRCLQFDPAQRPGAADVSELFKVERRALSAPREVPATLTAARQARSPRVLPWLGGVVLVAVLAVGGYLLWSRLPDAADVAQPAAAPGVATVPAASTATLRVERSPSDLRLLVDGEVRAEQLLSLPPGSHRLVGLAAGHYGKVSQLQVAAGDNPPFKFELQAQQLPSSAEFDRFDKFTEEAYALSEADVTKVPERALQDVLRHKWLQRSGAAAQASELKRQVDELVALGDPRAAVTALLIDALAAGGLRQSLVSGPLRAASAGGDAMASFFWAAALRSGLGDSIAAGDAMHAELCRLLRLSRDQGWTEVATRTLDASQCPRR